MIDAKLRRQWRVAQYLTDIQTQMQKADNEGVDYIVWRVPDGCESWRVAEVLEDLEYSVDLGGDKNTGPTLHIRWW